MDEIDAKVRIITFCLRTKPKSMQIYAFEV